MEEEKRCSRCKIKLEKVFTFTNWDNDNVGIPVYFYYCPICDVETEVKK